MQRACVRYLTLAGWAVWVCGQYDARRTQTPGVPDAVAFAPGRMMWLEFKRPAGRQSPAQRRFQAACEAAGVAYHVIRSVDELVALVTGGRDG